MHGIRKVDVATLLRKAQAAMRPTYLASLQIAVAACVALVCAACSGGGEPSPVPPPLPPPSPTAVSGVCPLGNTVDIGINTAASARYAKPIDATGVGPDSIDLDCGGGKLTGTVSVDGDTLRFQPAAPLPPGTACTVQAGAGLHDVDGAPLSPAAWTFQTGSREKQQWQFTAPVEAISRAGPLLDALYADTNPVVIASFRDTLYVSSSQDGGATFSQPTPIVTPDFGTNQELDAIYENGRLHIAWRFLPYNVWESDLLHAQSTVDLSTFTEPAYVTLPYDGLQDFHPSLTTDKNGTVTLAWQENCSYGRADCSLEENGTHLAKIDPGSGQVVLDQRLTTAYEQIPAIAGFDDAGLLDDGLILAWAKSHDGISFSVEVVVPSENNRVIGSPGQTGERVWRGFKLARIDGRKGVLHWEEGLGAGDHSFFLADVDPIAKTVGAARPLMFASFDEYRFYCSRIVTDGAGTMAWLSSLSARKDANPGDTIPTTITIRLSRDGGHTFDDPIPIDFLLPPIYVSSPHFSQLLRSDQI